MCTVGTIYHKRTGSIKINMAAIKGCNSCIYQSTKILPLMGFTSILTQKPQSSQQGKNGKGQNVFGLLLATLRCG